MSMLYFHIKEINKKNIIFFILISFYLSVSAEVFSNNIYKQVIDTFCFVRIDTGAIVNDLGYSQAIAWGDYNNDLFPDIYVSNSWINDYNLVYLNNKDGSFTKITSGIIANDKANSNGCSWGDFNNDGFIDLYVANVNNQKNFLYKNNGDCTFDKIIQGDIVNDTAWSYGCAWGDYDNDGYLDLYVSNWKGQKNSLYHNSKDGSFCKILTGNIVNDIANSMNASWCDFDNDGYLDLYVVNIGKNFLYKNIGGNYFKKINSGDIVNEENYSYGCSIADYDNDCDMDVFVTNWNQKNSLYRNDGNFSFTKINDPPFSQDYKNSEGSSWGDYNNDGFIDLFVTNDGVCNLYENINGSFFKNINNSILTLTENNSNGTAWTDYDNDGDLDLFIANGGNQKNIFYVNKGNNNHWLEIKLVSEISNKSAIGTKVLIKYGINKIQYQEVSSQTGGGCGAQKDLRLHFGLKDYNYVDTVIVKWPSGICDSIFDIYADKLIVIHEPEIIDSVYLNCDIFISQNFPNPFKNDTYVNIFSNKTRKLTLKVYDNNGKLVYVPLKNKLIIKYYKVIISGDSLSSSGVYYYVLSDGNFEIKKKMIFSK